MCWILLFPMIVVIGMSRQYSHFIISILNASSVSSIISLLYVFMFNECPYFTQFFTPVPKISFFPNKQFILNFFFLELGKLPYARVSKFGFLGDTCARLIVGYDVKGKAIWTNLNVAVKICGRCYTCKWLVTMELKSWPDKIFDSSFRVIVSLCHFVTSFRRLLHQFS